MPVADDRSRKRNGYIEHMIDVGVSAALSLLCDERSALEIIEVVRKLSGRLNIEGVGIAFMLDAPYPLAVAPLFGCAEHHMLF